MILKFIENDGVTGARLTIGEKPIPNGSFLYRDGRYIRGGELGTIPAFATHRHAGETLQHIGVSSAATAFSFATAGPVTFSQLINAESSSTFGNLTLADGSITDSSGAISFGDENLTTTGTIQSAAIGCGVAPDATTIGKFYRNDASTASMLKIEQGSTGDASIHLTAGGTDYSLGIDNSNNDFFFLSPASVVGGVGYFSMNSVGNVGIGRTPVTGTQLYAQQRDTNTAINVLTTLGLGWSTANGAHEIRGFTVNARHYPSVGINNTGTLYGLILAASQYGSSGAGNITALKALHFTYGNDGAGNGNIANAFGTYTQLRNASGTITTSYDTYYDAPTTGGTVTNEWCIYSDHVAPSRLIDDLQIADDDKSILIGIAQDFGISYNGTEGYIDTGLIAPSDLLIDCGTEKTIELVESVWDDLQFQITAGKQPGSSAPTWATLTTNTGEYGFDVNDYIDLASNELNHGWKEGTTGNFHLHISIPDANATGSSRYAQFTIYVAYVNASSIWTETSLTAEQEIPDGSSALENFYLDLGDVSFAGLDIGTQVKVNVKRITATGGTEYGSDVFIHQVGCHLEYDTIGSRQETIK